MDSREAYQGSLFGDAINPHIKKAPTTISKPKRRKIEALAEIQINPPEQEDLAYLLTILANCYMPRNPVKGRTYAHNSGSYGVVITGGAATNPNNTEQVIEQAIPHGTKARQFISYINTEAVRTQSRTINLGDSLNDLVHRVTGQQATGGSKGNLNAWKQALMGFSTCNIAFEDLRSNNSYAQKRFNFIQEFRLWLPDKGDGKQTSLFPTTLVLSQEYYDMIVAVKSMPLDNRALRELAEYPLAYDVYVWLCYRIYTISKRDGGPQPLPVNWNALKKQFSQNKNIQFAKFKFELKKGLERALTYYCSAKVDIVKDGIILHPSPPAIAGRTELVGVR